MKLHTGLPFALSLCALGLVLAGCDPPAPPDGGGPEVPRDPMETPMPGADMMAGPPEVPTILCPAKPATGPKGSWRHSIGSPVVVALGDPRHRSVDLIAGSMTSVQRIRGEISYGLADKALEDEEVEIYACRQGSWSKVGNALTNGDGHFELTLTGSARLPIGKRSLYYSVIGDRSGVFGLAMVLPAGNVVAVSDIDGTLTDSENAYPESLLTGGMVAIHDGAKDALSALAQRRYHFVYLTSRGRVFTEPTRSWLAGKGLPLGPVRLAPSLITVPGEPTVAYKAGQLGEILGAGLSIGLGNGNRASDATAYSRVGVDKGRIFLKQPEYKSENDPIIARGEATGFENYKAILPTWSALPIAP